MQVDNIVDWPVQLGPEFIHGAKSSLKVCSYYGYSKLRLPPLVNGQEQSR